MSGGKSTYCKGFQMNYTRELSSKDFYDMCKKIGVDYNKHFQSDRFVVVPEGVEGGGIEIIDRDNKSHYKSLRLDQHSGYPWIRNAEDLKDDTTIIFQKTNNRTKKTTTLKATNHAPAWTLEELAIFKDVFEQYDIKVSCMPKSNRSLIYKQPIE